MHLHQSVHRAVGLDIALTEDEAAGDVGSFAAKAHAAVDALCLQNGVGALYDFCAHAVGEQADVLWESTMRGGWMYGYTGNYIRVKAPYRRDMINRICRVKLSSIGDDHDIEAEIL